MHHDCALQRRDQEFSTLCEDGSAGEDRAALSVHWPRQDHVPPTCLRGRLDPHAHSGGDHAFPRIGRSARYQGPELRTVERRPYELGKQRACRAGKRSIRRPGGRHEFPVRDWAWEDPEPITGLAGGAACKATREKVGREARIGGRGFLGFREAYGRWRVYLELGAAGFGKHRAGLAEDHTVQVGALDLEPPPHRNDPSQSYLGRTSELAGKQATDVASEGDAVASVLVGKSPVALIYGDVLAHPRCGEIYGPVMQVAAVSDDAPLAMRSSGSRVPGYRARLG
jgi:hypothetical protein